MSKCPDCGEENVPEPEGMEAHCGRRISWASVAETSTKGWRERITTAQVCKEIGRRRHAEKAE